MKKTFLKFNIYRTFGAIWFVCWLLTNDRWWMDYDRTISNHLSKIGWCVQHSHIRTRITCIKGEIIIMGIWPSSFGNHAICTKCQSAHEWVPDWWMHLDYRDSTSKGLIIILRVPWTGKNDGVWRFPDHWHRQYPTAWGFLAQDPGLIYRPISSRAYARRWW